MVSTASEEAQQYFDQGLTWLFAFNHDEAIQLRNVKLEPAGETRKIHNEAFASALKELWERCPNDSYVGTF